MPSDQPLDPFGSRSLQAPQKVLPKSEADEAVLTLAHGVQVMVRISVLGAVICRPNRNLERTSRNVQGQRIKARPDEGAYSAGVREAFNRAFRDVLMLQSLPFIMDEPEDSR